MYVIRRVWTVEPKMARRAATLVAESAKVYENAGQRSDVRVYFNGGTVPGEKDRVYMEWVADKLESPYREGNVIPKEASPVAQELRKYTTGTWIEFYELFTPAKAQHE